VPTGFVRVFWIAALDSLVRAKGDKQSIGDWLDAAQQIDLTVMVLCATLAAKAGPIKITMRKQLFACNAKPHSCSRSRAIEYGSCNDVIKSDFGSRCAWPKRVRRCASGFRSLQEQRNSQQAEDKGKAQAGGFTQIAHTMQC